MIRFVKRSLFVGRPRRFVDSWSGGVAGGKDRLGFAGDSKDREGVEVRDVVFVGGTVLGMIILRFIIIARRLNKSLSEQKSNRVSLLFVVYFKQGGLLI